MPSLIYIARVMHSSEELAERLRAAGFQVRSFGPGEITNDECLLVMTPEAAAAGLPSADSVPPTTGAVKTGLESEVTPLPFAEMRAHLGSQVAFWDCLKTGTDNAFAATASSMLRERASAVAPSPITSSAAASSQIAPMVGEPKNLGFIPSEAGLRALKRSPPKSTLPPPRLQIVRKASSASGGGPGVSLAPAPPGEPSPVVPSRIPAILPSKTPDSGGETLRVNRMRTGVYLRPAAAAAALLILAVVLLINPPATPSSSVGATASDADQSSKSGSGARDSARKVSERQSPGTASKALAGLRQRPSDYDFVAEDFTTHFAVHANGGAAPQNPELKRNAQGNAERKRVVIN